MHCQTRSHQSDQEASIFQPLVDLLHEPKDITISPVKTPRDCIVIQPKGMRQVKCDYGVDTDRSFIKNPMSPSFKPIDIDFMEEKNAVYC